MICTLAHYLLEDFSQYNSDIYDTDQIVMILGNSSTSEELTRLTFSKNQQKIPISASSTAHS